MGKLAAYPDDVAAVFRQFQIPISDSEPLDPWILGYLWRISAVPSPLWLRRKPDPQLVPGVTFKDAGVVADFFSKLDIAGDALAVMRQAQHHEHFLQDDSYWSYKTIDDAEFIFDRSFCFLDGFQAAEMDISRNNMIKAQSDLQELERYLRSSHLCLRCGTRVYAEPAGYGICLNCGL